MSGRPIKRTLRGGLLGGSLFRRKMLIRRCLRRDDHAAR